MSHGSPRYHAKLLFVHQLPDTGVLDERFSSACVACAREELLYEKGRSSSPSECYPFRHKMLAASTLLALLTFAAATPVPRGGSYPQGQCVTDVKIEPCYQFDCKLDGYHRIDAFLNQAEQTTRESRSITGRLTASCTDFRMELRLLQDRTADFLRLCYGHICRASWTGWSTGYRLVSYVVDPCLC